MEKMEVEGIWKVFLELEAVYSLAWFGRVKLHKY